MLRLTIVFTFTLGMAAVAHAADCSATAHITNPAVEAAPWNRWERAITTGQSYLGASGRGNPSRDLELKLTFTQCDGTDGITYTGRGFWYGLPLVGQAPNQTPNGKTFRIRGAFPKGTWQWVLTCTRRGDHHPDTPDCSGDPALNTVGKFKVEGTSTGLLAKNGFLKVKGTSLVFEKKNTNFFWLGDTVWNANVATTADEWDALITNRTSGAANRKFTVLQMGFAPKAALGDNPPEDKKPFHFTGGTTHDNQNCNTQPEGPAECYRFNPLFWQELDDKVQKANAKGLVVVLAGFIHPITGTGDKVPTNELEAQYFAEEVAARLRGNFVIYSPGFDHKLDKNIGIIDKVGTRLRDVDLRRKPGEADRSIHLITNHPAGGSNTGDYTTYQHSKQWLDFELFQSGTPRAPKPNNSLLDELLKFTGRAVSFSTTLSMARTKPPENKLKPAINGESVYPGIRETYVEDPDHPDVTITTAQNHTPYRARQTAWYSMLSGAKGYTAGVCGVFNDGLPGNCLNWAPPNDGGVVKTLDSMRNLRAIVQQVRSWQTLTPQPSRIKDPLNLPADRQVVVAYDLRDGMLVYVPNEIATIKVDFTDVRNYPAEWVAKWVNPRDPNDVRDASPLGNLLVTFSKPGGAGPSSSTCENYENNTNPAPCNDWVLRVLRNAKAQVPTSGATIEVINAPDLQVMAKTKSSSGVLLGEQLVSNVGTSAPQIATEAGGMSMVVWQADDGNDVSIVGRFLDAQGNPQGSEFTIASGDEASPGHPAIGALGNGTFVVAWAGGDQNHYGPWIRMRQYSSAGTPPPAATFAVACSFVPGDYPRVTGVGSSGYAIAWEMLDGSGIYVLKDDGSGNKSDARLAQNSGAIAVLEALDLSGSSTLTVSYGLYTDDGIRVGGSTPTVSLQSACNVPTLAYPDAFSTDANKAITIGLHQFLANDAPGLTFDHADPKCVVTADGCTYTPPLGFTGTDTFTYWVHDAQNHLGSALVTITVNPPLVANPDNFTMEGDGALQITSTQLLANDSQPAVFVDVLNAVNGTVSCVGTAPAVCTFTPFSGFRGTASFQYRISRDGNEPYATGNVTITVTPPSGMQVTSRCTDGVCVFTAIAPNANAARSYVWRVDNGASFTSVYKINYRFTSGGSHTVSVIVLYNYGLPQQQGSTSVTINYADAPTWRTSAWGLGFQLDEFHLSMFPFGTTPAINWSADPGDCADPAWGCGDVFIGSDTSCDFQNCRVYGSYSHTGIFDGTLRFMNAGQIVKEYPVAFEAVNQLPEPSFTFSRPDPNVRNYVFTNVSGGDDGPDPLTYQWDFGDGTTDTGSEDKSHLYDAVGTYFVTLTVTDGEGLIGTYEAEVEVTNAPPVPRITVTCRGADCELGGETSTDDGANIATWDWAFGDGTSASGSRVIHHYAPGCYTVTLTVTDGDGGSTSTTQTVVAGPPLVSANTEVVVDAHVQSYYANVNGVTGWNTTNGNLNGIVEPGETVVVEPTWSIAPSTQPLPVSALGVSPWGNQYGFRHTAPSYNVSTGVSDCWSNGDCYAVFVLPQFAQSRPVHADIQFNETNLTTGQLTPGSPVTIHVGKSFSDVAATHWSYAGIESVLHAGVDTGCGGTQFCPGTVVTRGEVARWLLRAEHGATYQPPACTSAPFTDVPCSHPFAAWIAQLKAEGITGGTGGGNYSPDQALTRAEAAVFLIRTKMGAAYVPPACSSDFGDVLCGGTNGHWAAAWISDIKARGISNGCDLTAFCPGDAVDRAQAAALFAKTFDLRIDTLQCPIVTNGGLDLVPTHVDLPPIVGITFNPDPAVVGGPSTATMTIGDPPPTSTAIPLSIDNPAASVPSSVTVPAGGTSATFAVTPANITVRTTTHITATYLGTPKTVALDICTPPPTITAHPTSRIIDNGQPTTLSVTATGGGGPLSYQWYQGLSPSTATPVPGATGSILTVTPSVTTSYWVRVSATCGYANSVTATVTVCNPPQIPGPPLNDVVVIGNPATLTVNATGSGPLTYQWYEGASGNTASPVGTNAPAYTTPAINVVRSYWVRVTDTCNGTRTVDSPTAIVTPVTQISRRQLAANTVNSLTSITTNWTRPTQPGSLLVAVMSSSHVAAVGAFTVPAGWQQAAGYEWNHLKTTIYYYPNNPGGRTSETITTAGYRESVLQLIEYVGATTAPLDGQPGFDGDHLPRSGEVSTGTTQWMSQSKAVVVSALSTNTLASFTSPTNSFVRIDERSVYQSLTAAVHERMVSAVANYGHTASVDNAGEWLGLVATFKSIDGCTAAPAITAQPASTTVNAGASATLSVTATGGSLQYQWYQGAAPSTAAPVTGGNGPTLTVTPAATTSYWVRVFNACGTANSNTATVNVCAPLGIATHPLSQSVTSGFAATLSVTPSGSGPFSYQWYEGASGTTTTPVSGATSATYTTPPLFANKSYWVRVTGTCNGSTSVNSNTATLTVSAASSIARRQLAASSANSQTSITTNWTQPTQAGSLLVAVISAQHGAAVGTLTPPAGWQLAVSYEMANIKSAIYYYPNNPGGRTSETFGAAGFRELVLQLLEYTGATSSPLDKIAFNGDMTSPTSLVSTGTTQTTSQAKEVVVTALTMMAQMNFTNPTNGFVRLDQRNVYNMITASVHERIVTTAGPWGHTADVDASNQWVGLVATFKSLDLCTAPPTITAQPGSPTIASGGTATLSVTATTSGGTLSYQWFEGASGTTTTPVGTNSATFTTPALTASKSYWVRVSNECGNVASTTATVTVCVPPAIGTQPASTTINSGQTATLTVVASGTAPLSYQWYEGASGTTTTPVGTNSASFTTPALTATRSYWVRVTNACGSVNSTAATVTVCAPPAITAHPASTSINSGSTATLTVVATGSGLSYQWYEGPSGTTTTPVGTNSASFTTPALTTTKSYWVRVTGTCNGTASVNSNTATVTVCNATGITTQPASQTITSGGTATLSVVASGSAPFTYQWYEGASGTTTTPVGTNSASFTTPALTATKSYWVRVTGGCGSANSNTATITVNAPVLARRQLAAGTANSQLTITTGWTQPTQAGTLLVAIVSAERGAYPIANWQPPAGWQHAVSYEMVNVKTSIYYYPNNPGGRTSETFGNGGYYDDMILQLAEYTGVVTVAPLDKTAFNGDHTNDGYVDTGYTQQTAQAKELVITALTSHSLTEFYNPSSGFLELDDRNQGWGNLTTAVHEKIVTTAGSWGHYAQVGNTTQWVGVVATFKGQ